MSDAQWTTVDLDTLTASQRQAYDAYKVVQRQAAELRQGFEGTMQAGIPQGKRLVFGYRFGKLSVALVEDDRKPSKAKDRPMSLADYLASQG